MEKDINELLGELSKLQERINAHLDNPPKHPTVIGKATQLRKASPPPMPEVRILEPPKAVAPPELVDWAKETLEMIQQEESKVPPELLGRLKQIVGIIDEWYWVAWHDEGGYMLPDEAITLKPWEHIPDIGSNRLILQMWHEGHTAKEIARRLGFSAKTVHNKLSDWRKTFGEEVVRYKHDPG